MKQKIAGAVDIGGIKIKLGIVSETGRVLGESCSLMKKIVLQYKNGMWNLMIVFKPQIVILGGGFMKKYFSFAEGLLRCDLDFVEQFKIYPAGEFGDPALAGASRLIL